MASIGEGSSSSSASTPTSSRSWSWTYHVFLSFRGKDTRKGFIGHLDAALKRRGITIFKDDRDLQKGDVISDELLQAIDESMFAITVLSPNYATSVWCLDELQRMVERSKDRGLVIFPIFYDVEPSDVRYQNNSFKEAFEKQEGRFGQGSEKVRKWRDALTSVARCSGWNSKDGHEAAQVESIAQDIHKKLIPKLPSCAEDFVGIQSQVEDLCSFLGRGLNDIRFIGIWGMGGIGKTTLARTVYEAIQGDFKVSCFLANVREEWEKKKIVKIQENLVSHVNISKNTFHNEHDGRKIIQSSLCNKKVLLVIDDVSEARQLKNLAGKQDWFGPGSRIIITTRNIHLLEIYEGYESYKVKGLNQNEALKLFCMKAFKQDQPKEGYLDLSKEVVKYCAGLPLALDILGSFLCGRTTATWQSGLRKIKSDQDRQIFDKLKISYDDLDSTTKNIFLDIACFFKGETIDDVIDILQKCGYNPQIEIDVLIQRSLVTQSEKGTLEMHDLVEELGKKIVIQECPDDPGKRSRLWSKQDIKFVLTKNKGTEAIQSIVKPDLLTKCSSVEAFSNMSKLRLLKISGMELPPSLNDLPLPSSLKVLHWTLCPFKTLPLGDEKYEVVEIVLVAGDIEQPWHGKKFLKKLTDLELSSCRNLKQMPDLSAVLNLEKLRLFACDYLTEVHPSLIHHENLVVLDLSECRRLKTFPGKLEMSSLKELILDGCHGLEDLPEFGECMKHLLRLSLKKTGICQLPWSIRNLVGLEELILTSCREFVCLPITIHELMSLRILKASQCNRLYGLPDSLFSVPFLSSLDLSFCGLTESKFPPDGFDHFPSLMELNLSGNDFVRVPISIHKLPKLQHLSLRKCPNLQSLPELPASIRKLDAQNCDSLRASDSNPLTKAYRVFASPSQDNGLVLQMLITREEIPSWFVHQQKGNCVSAPLQHDFPQNERLGIALCFEISSIGESNSKSGCRLDVRNGNKLITKMICDIEYGCNLYILYLSNNYFSNKMQLDNQFELSISDPYNILNIWRSAAWWMHKQDIEDFKKIEHMASVAGEASSYSSSTSSPTSRSWTYDVVLSFRGEDTREGFLDHLFAALRRKGITVFKDAARVLQKGDVISDELLQAIDESMFAITILSPNYAASTWCLDELQRIVERSKDRGLVIFPIFYDVEPSDVSYQNNSFKEAFDQHEGRFGQDSEKVRKWRDALTTVAGCSGWNSKDEHEAIQVESIAQDIHEKLIPKLPSCTKDFVGIQSQVEDLSSFLGRELNDVRFIGIWGIGGIGKTTLARTVYDAIQGDFKVSCFLANVREVCDKKNIVEMQKNLVSRVNMIEITFANEYDGRKIIQSTLCNKKVLLVIDDVSEESQLKNLAGKQDWFGPGSRIIITTRNIHLLEIYGVYGSYEVKGLSQNEALQLFCMKAFKQDQPKEGYLDLSEEVVKYCAGLPLALEILGSYLCGRTVDAWQSGLRKIKSDQYYDIFDKLKISYDDLDSMKKNIFLDIACFFKGMTKDHIMDILQKCGYNPQIEIGDLIQRSLVTLTEKGTLEMHDLVEELGKKIVIEECPDDPGKRSRLWYEMDIKCILIENKGTEAIQSIVNPYLYNRCGSVEAFSNMSQLKLLIIGGTEHPPGRNYPPLPSSLKVLHWDECPLETLPLGDEQYELVEIVLYSGNIKQPWHGKKILKKLRNLKLGGCPFLEQMPDLSGAPNLEKLSLPDCHFLTEVHPSLIHHQNLVLLDLSGCWGLKTFPGKLEMSSLKELILDECEGLEDLPEFGECMKHLLRLSLKWTRIRELPSSIGRLVGLEELLLQECRFLYSLSHLPFLRSLDLSSCLLAKHQFPFADFDHFLSLTELNLSGNDFVSVPISIHKLPKLQHLWLDNCPNLQFLPELPSSIRELDARKCHSLYASEFNPLSNAYGVFASPSQDHGVVFQMLITGKKIPSWFVHQQEGNCVSAPLQHDFPQNERLGIALCFEMSHKMEYGISECAWHLGVRNGKRLITKIFRLVGGCNLYIVYLSNDYFSNKMRLDNQFELSASDPDNEFKIRRSAARWIHKQDIEDLKKSEAT